MNSQFLQQAVDCYWEYADVLFEMTVAGHRSHHFENLKQCGLGVVETSHALQMAEDNLLPLAPLVLDSLPSSASQRATRNLLLAIHWLSSQVAGLAKERFSDPSYSYHLGQQLPLHANRAEQLIATMDKYVSMYTSYLVKGKPWTSMGNPRQDSIKCGVLWVDKGLNAVAPLEERTVMKEDLRYCSEKLAYAGVLQDDDCSSFKGSPRPVLVLPNGKWRPDSTTGKESCEAYVLDITETVTRSLGKAAQNNGIRTEQDFWENYQYNAQAIDTEAQGVSVMMAHGGNILQATAHLVEFLVELGMVKEDEKWMNVFTKTLVKVEKVVREISAEDNPDAKYEIGGWS